MSFFRWVAFLLCLLGVSGVAVLGMSILGLKVRSDKEKAQLLADSTGQVELGNTGSYKGFVDERGLNDYPEFVRNFTVQLFEIIQFLLQPLPVALLL